MTSVWGCGRPCRECPSVAPSVALSVIPPDSSPPPESDDKLPDQLARPLVANLFVAVVPAAAPPVPKNTEEDLQYILKTVLKAGAPTTSEEPWDKPLKARFPDVYQEKSHMEC